MQSVVERYYASYYATKNEVRALGEDEVFCVYQHHNGLCILVLAPEHPIRKLGLLIDRVDFNVNGSDNSKKKVSGKKKKGGLQLQPHSVLCKVYTKSGPSTSPESSSPPLKRQKCDDKIKEWNIYACIKGFLIEPNLSLLKTPSLLVSRPDTDGYLAIIMANRNQAKYVTEKLIPKERYNTLIVKKLEEVEATNNIDSESNQKTNFPVQLPVE